LGLGLDPGNQVPNPNPKTPKKQAPNPKQNPKTQRNQVPNPKTQKFLGFKNVLFLLRYFNEYSFPDFFLKQNTFGF
jgi:hypothetical protein